MKTRELREYAFWGDVDVKKAEELHRLTQEFRDTLFTNYPLQNVLFNRGAEMTKKERPTSYIGLIDAVFLRTKVMLHLSVLEEMIEQATRPQILVVKSPPLIIVPGQEEKQPKIETLRGVDAGKVEQFQREWMENSTVNQAAREFQTALTECFDEFNLKFMLTRMFYSTRQFVPDEWREERRIADRIDKVADNKSYGALDNAYYGMARRLMSGVSPYWDRLASSELGRMFIVTPEQERDYMKKLYSRAKFTG